MCVWGEAAAKNRSKDPTRSPAERKQQSAGRPLTGVSSQQTAQLAALLLCLLIGQRMHGAAERKQTALRV